jgi:hypothetical protein
MPSRQSVPSSVALLAAAQDCQSANAARLDELNLRRYEGTLAALRDAHANSADVHEDDDDDMSLGED